MYMHTPPLRLQFNPVPSGQKDVFITQFQIELAFFTSTGLKHRAKFTLFTSCFVSNKSQPLKCLITDANYVMLGDDSNPVTLMHLLSALVLPR